MGDLVKVLNDNSGAVLAAATIAYTVITLALLLEARGTRVMRREAQLEAYPRPWERAPMYIAISVVNYGPAIARNVDLTFWLEKDGEEVGGSRRVHGEPLFPSGWHRTFLPDRDDAGGATTLDELANQGLTLRLQWSWTDGRQWPWKTARPRERRTVYSMADLRTKFYGGGALVESDAAASAERAADEVGKIRSVLENLDRRLERGQMEYLLAQRQRARQPRTAGMVVKPEVTDGA